MLRTRFPSKPRKQRSALGRCRSIAASRPFVCGSRIAPPLVLFRLRFLHEEQIRDSRSDGTDLFFLHPYGVFLRLNLRAVGIGVNLSKLCAEEQDLGGIEDPE